MEDPSEEIAVRLLAKYGLRAEQLTKAERRAGKTPDYRVFEGADFRFFCEVKGVSRDTWLDRELAKVPSGVVVGGLRPDPTFNRLTDDIHEAVKQFDAVNSALTHPNVLVFVNHERLCGFPDLIGVITGQFLADTGKAYPIYRWYSEGRIMQEKSRIDLYIWLDAPQGEHLLFSRVREEHYLTLCGLFNVDPQSVRDVGA